MDRSKDQGQGHTRFDNEYLGNDERYEDNFYCQQVACHVRAFLSHIYI